NLAHSLKTPLAVMRASLSGGAPAGPVGAEIDRMSGIIEHQLKRAAASGGALLGQAPVEVAQVASELRGTLLKVYAGKDLPLERGVRADQNVPGHGLGLAMVHDTVDLYGGQLAIDASPLGGARISLRLPGR